MVTKKNPNFTVPSDLILNELRSGVSVDARQIAHFLMQIQKTERSLHPSVKSRNKPDYQRKKSVWIEQRR